MSEKRLSSILGKIESINKGKLKVKNKDLVVRGLEILIERL